MVDVIAKRRRKTISKDGPDPVDVHVGMKLRQRRTLLGMSQERLAQAFGVSFQQVQKYERGANRISASRLHTLAGLLEVPVAYFFEDLPSGAEQEGVERPVRENGSDPVASRETLELVRAYYRIPDPAVRKSIIELARSLGGAR